MVDHDKHIEYDPIFTSMWKQKLIPPVFSLAVERHVPNGGLGGYLALGGIPTVPVQSPFASTRIVNVPSDTGDVNKTKELLEYTFLVEGMTFQASVNASARNQSTTPPPVYTNMTNFYAILDSGTARLYLPMPQANVVNSLFQPAARFDERLGVGWIHCSAIPPRVGFQIGGQVFQLNPQDLVQDNHDGTCSSTVLGNPSGGGILGIQFFWNTLVVHDVGESVIRLASRNVNP